MNQGKDTTLEPAYFARRNMGTSSSGSSDNTEVNKKLSELTKKVNELDKDSEERQKAVDDLAKELNKLFEQEKSQDEKIEELATRLDSLKTGCECVPMEPIPNSLINELEFIN